MFFAPLSVSKKSVRRKKTQMNGRCREGRETHNYKIKLYCKVCDRSAIARVFDRPCGRKYGDTHELKNVGCRVCGNTDRTIRMFFKCMPGGQDYENYAFAHIRVTNIDEYTDLD